jgi:hypothetical protein
MKGTLNYRRIKGKLLEDYFMTRDEIKQNARNERIKCRSDIEKVIRPADNNNDVVILSTTEIMRLVWGKGKIIENRLPNRIVGKSGELEKRSKLYWEIVSESGFNGVGDDRWHGFVVTGDETKCPWGAKFVGQNLTMMGFVGSRTRDKRGYFCRIVDNS